MILETRFVLPEGTPNGEDEEWAEVDYGYYVSNYGRIWSGRSQQFLKPKRLDKHGHVGLCINNHGTRKYLYLHRLIAEEFLPNPNEYPIVRHLNDDPTDNYVDNLAWGTRHDNMQDCIDNGNSYDLTDEDRERGLEKIRIPVKSIDLKTGDERHYRSIADAARDLGLWSANIQKVLYKERRHTGGYYFEQE